LHTFLKELAYPNIAGKAGYKPKEKNWECVLFEEDDMRTGIPDKRNILTLYTYGWQVSGRSFGSSIHLGMTL
jgi:hypothetical protein